MNSGVTAAAGPQGAATMMLTERKKEVLKISGWRWRSRRSWQSLRRDVDPGGPGYAEGVCFP